MAYADIITTNIVAAGTSAAQLMAAIAAHFASAPGHYEIDFTGTEDAIVVAPKAAPTGFDHQAALRIDGSGNLCLKLDPSSGFSNGGSVATSATSGGALVAPERNTSISSGIGSTTITIIEDVDWCAILLYATSKTHMVKGAMFGHTWDPLRPNWASDLGMSGFGQHIGIPNVTSSAGGSSGQWFGSGVSPRGSDVLINGSWYQAAMTLAAYNASSLPNCTIPNGVNPTRKVVMPIQLAALSVNSSANLTIGHTRTLGTVATNEDSAQLPRRMIDAGGGPVVETWMHLNIANSTNNLVIAMQPGAAAP